MLMLEYLRREAGLTIRGLRDKCNPPVGENYICRAEKWGDHLSDAQLERLAVALGWDKDPALLVAPVEIAEVR